MNRILLTALLGAAAVTAFGQQGRRPGAPPAAPASPESSTPAAPAESTPPAVEKFSKTQHTIHLGGSELAYTATAGTLILRRDDGKARASIFFIAYTLDSATDKSRRAVVLNVFSNGVLSASDAPPLEGVPPVPIGHKMNGQFFPLLFDPEKPA